MCFYNTLFLTIDVKLHERTVVVPFPDDCAALPQHTVAAGLWGNREVTVPERGGAVCAHNIDRVKYCRRSNEDRKRNWSLQNGFTGVMLWPDSPQSGQVTK